MEDYELLADLAHDYYIAQLSLAELTEKYQLSRYLVNRYLEDARTSGIISFSIANLVRRNHALEQQFKELFDISKIYIVKNSDEKWEDFEPSFFQFAAEKIADYIDDSRIVGTFWGETIYDLIDNFSAHTQENLTFTQVVGENRKYKSSAGSMRLVEHAAQKFDAKYLTLSGPLYIVNPETRQGMLEEFASQPALNAARQMDLLFTGLGTLASVNSIVDWRENIDQIFPRVRLEKVVGMIYGRPYDISGRILNRNRDCVFGLSLAEILKTPRRIGVVKSKFKTQATLGALRGKFFTDLIITESIANRILTELNMTKEPV